MSVCIVVSEIPDSGAFFSTTTMVGSTLMVDYFFKLVEERVTPIGWLLVVGPMSAVCQAVVHVVRSINVLLLLM
jgi:hypothetical protein